MYFGTTHLLCRSVLRRSVLALALCSLLTGVASRRSQAQVQLLINGGFETGDFTGWTVANRPLGSAYSPTVPAQGRFAIQAASGTTPFSGLSALTPPAGNYYALSDTTAQGTHTLSQRFFVPNGTTSVSLSFQMYVYDWYGGGALNTGGPLDHSTGTPTQYARVDLLTGNAGAFDTGSGSVLTNFYLGVDPESAQGQAPFFRTYTADLTSFVTPGSFYQLRFAEVDNQFVINQAVDSVSVTAVTSVPEPSTVTLLLAATPVAWRLGRRTRRRQP